MRGSGGKSARVAVAWSAAGLLAVALVAAVPGSPLQPVLPEGAGPSGPFRWLAGLVALDRVSGNALVGVAVAAVTTAAVGFLLLLREAWRGTLSLRLVVGLAIAAHLAVMFLPLLVSRDVYSYAIEGRIAGVHGGNPYVATAQDYRGDPVAALVGPKWLDTPAVYGPGFTLVSAGLARAIDGLPGLIVAYRAIAAAASLATLWIVVRLASRLRPERASFAAAVVGLNPVVLFQSVGSGHNDLLVALAIAGALALLLSGRSVLAAAVLTLGALVKATAGLPLLLLVVWAVARKPAGERGRALAAHAGAAAAIALAVAAPFLQKKDPTLGMLELATHEGWLAPSRFFGRVLGGLAGWLAGDGGRAAVSGAVRVAFAAGLVAAVAVLALAVARRSAWLDALALGAAWGWALLLLMLLGPVLLPWYVTWALPLAWLMPRAPWAALIGTSTALAVSQFAAEPSRFPRAYDVNVLLGHYVITPVVVVVLAWLARDLVRRLREGSALAEEPGEVAPEAGHP